MAFPTVMPKRIRCKGAHAIMRSTMVPRLLFCLVFLLVLPAVSFADDKEDSKKYYEEGKAKYDAGDLDGAIALLDKAFELDARNFKAQKLLAESLESKGKQQQFCGGTITSKPLASSTRTAARPTRGS